MRRGDVCLHFTRDEQAAIWSHATASSRRDDDITLCKHNKLSQRSHSNHGDWWDFIPIDNSRLGLEVNDLGPDMTVCDLPTIFYEKDQKWTPHKDVKLPCHSGIDTNFALKRPTLIPGTFP